MLACRPMLCFAVAVMLGVALTRFHPDALVLLLPGWLVFLCLSVWFALTPRRLSPAPPELPDGYARHILPRPGWIAARGMNRFIVVACLGLFLVAMMRQQGWDRAMDRSRLPEKRWFDAIMLASAPAGLVEGTQERWRVPASLLSCDGEALAEAVPIRLMATSGAPLRRGDLVRARVRLQGVSPKTYPGAFDFQFFLERDGLLASAEAVKSRFAKDAPLVRVVPVDTVPWHVSLRRWIDWVRFKAVAATLRYGGDEGGMLATMLFGYRSEMDGEVRDAFRRAGIGHVLAISGLHVGLVVWLLWWCCGWFAWPRRWRALACLCLAVLYLGLAGGQVAATRATVMAAIHLLGIAWGRGGDMLNSLGAAAFLLVLVNPTAPMDVGFQLSFTAVVFIHIALSRGPEGERPRPPAVSAGLLPRLARYARRELVSLTRLSVATWLGLYPIIAIVFNQVNLVGLPINIVVIPLMGVVLAGGLLLPVLGWIPGAAWLLTLPARVLTALAVWADTLPGSSFAAHAPSPEWVAVFFLFVGVYMLRGMLPSGKGRGAVTAAGLAGAAFGLLGVTLSMASSPPSAEGRLTHLPGSGLGVIVAEAPSGDIALLGTMRRGGLNEAGWLHYRKRGGTASVLAVGKAAPEEMRPFTYHYRMDVFAAVPATRKAAAGETLGWTPLPGAEGIEYAYCRDARGRMAALAVRTGSAAVCLVPQAGAYGIKKQIAAWFPGNGPDLLIPAFYDEGMERWRDAAAGVVAARGRLDGGLPEGWVSRNDYGALTVEDGAVLGYDGSAWAALERSASVSSATASALPFR